jgi:NADP-dependent 3-hydroxy acid dehydrogenase YdfG/tetratricopeptide (TPR) repeat protein
MNTNFIIFYCTDNQDIVNKFVADLTPVGAKFQLIEADKASSYQHLMGNSQPVMAFVSDNFLKNENCLYGAQSAFSDMIKIGRVMVIVTPGKVKNTDGSVSALPTQFERVSNVIQYMNFWQDQYLEARKANHQGTMDTSRLNNIRDISNQIGDFIRSLRDANYHYLENMVAKNYLQFSQITGLAQPTSVSDYSVLEQKTVVETPIPPMETPVETPSIILAEPIEVPKEIIEIAAPIVVPMVEEVVAEKETEVAQEVIEIPEVIENHHFVTNEKVSEDDELEEIISNIPGMDLLKDRPVSIGEVNKKMNVPEIDEDDFFNDKKHKTEHSNVNQIIEEVMKEESDDDDDELQSSFQRNHDDDDEEEMDLNDLFKKDTDAEEEEDEDIFDEILNKTEPSKSIVASIEPDAAAQSAPSDSYSEAIESDERKPVEPLAETIVIADETIEKNIEKTDNQEVIEYTEMRLNEENNHITTHPQEHDPMFEAMKAEIEAQPDNLRMRLRYAVALAQLQNNWQAATKQITFVLDKDPNNPDANFLLGEMAEVNKDYYLAQTYYEKTASVSPYYPNIYLKLAEMSNTHFEGQEKLTKKYFKKAIEIDAENPDLYYTYATFLNEKENNSEKAIKYFQKTLKIQPEHPFANYDLALIYYHLGDKYAAENFYEKAIANNSEIKTDENESVFRVARILTHERAQEAIEAGKEKDLELLSFESMVDDMPNSNIEAPTFTEEMTAAVNVAPVIEVAPIEVKKEKPNPEAKIVLITGATSGIGRATAEILAKDGYNLILTGRRGDRLEALSTRFNADYTGTTKTLVFDITKYEEVEKAIQSLDNEWFNIDVLLNNAGLGLGLDPIHTGNLAQWETMIDTNIKGLLYMTRLISPRMVENLSGHIINLCSTAGKEAYPMGNVYCATKFAVDALTKSMRIDLHKFNIRVSQVAPGAVEETEFSVVRFEGDVARADKVYADFQALRAVDVAEVIHFIISRPSHVNIQDVLMMGTQQATASMIDRSGRS